MKNYVVILLAVLTISVVYGQEVSDAQITKNWQLIQGWFPDENLRFNQDSTVEYLMNSESTDCMVGETNLRQGTWTLKKDILTLELRGLNVSDYFFWWKVK